MQAFMMRIVAFPLALRVLGRLFGAKAVLRGGAVAALVAALFVVGGREVTAKPNAAEDCNLKAFNGPAAAAQLNAGNNYSRRSRASEQVADIFAKCAIENEDGPQRARDLQGAYTVLESAGGDAIRASQRDRAVAIGRRLLSLTSLVMKKYAPSQDDFDVRTINFEAHELIRCAPTGVYLDPPNPSGRC
jgi:hypothetical protein